MQTGVIAGEFRRMFAAAQEVPLRERGVRTGAVDSRRAARVVHGDGRVFARRTVEREPVVMGSLAVCCAFGDGYWYNTAREWQRAVQANTWKEALESVFAAARQVGVPTRLFTAGQETDGRTIGEEDTGDTVLCEYEDPADFLKVSCAKTHNAWIRHTDAIQAASRWHEKASPAGRRVTLVLTMWPEIRCPADNRKRERFLAALARARQATAELAKGGRVYVLAVMPRETVRGTWGEAVSYGVERAIQEAYQSAHRLILERPDELPAMVRDLNRRMARMA
jgi:hypothetical protein